MKINEILNKSQPSDEKNKSPAEKKIIDLLKALRDMAQAGFENHDEKERIEKTLKFIYHLWNANQN